MEPVVNQLAQQAQRVFYGKYRGFVADNKDPQKRGRLLLRVPSVLGELTSGWALPCLPFGGLTDQGWFMVPEVGAQVWVEFEEGNVNVPIWVGVFWQQTGDIPSEAALEEPTTRLLKTPSGHTLQFDDKEGEEQFRLAHPAGTELIIDKNGTLNLTDPASNQLTLDAQNNAITLLDGNGNSLTMDSAGTVIEDANGNRVEMAAAGITVKGQMITIEGSQVVLGGAGGEPLIKGSSFLALFATHVHTATSIGAPTTPPIPQGEMSTLTTKTTAS